MKFNKATKVMKKLQEQGYVSEHSRIYKDYMHISPKCSESSVRSVIHTKIADVMRNIEEECAIRDYGEELECCNVTKLKQVLNLPTYGEMTTAFDKGEVDYVTDSITDVNDKCIGIYFRDDYVYNLVKDVIERMDGVELKRKDQLTNTLFLSTEKAKEWERKRENCKQIKFIEDFNEILNEVEGDE